MLLTDFINASKLLISSSPAYLPDRASLIAARVSLFGLRSGVSNNARFFSIVVVLIALFFCVSAKVQKYTNPHPLLKYSRGCIKSRKKARGRRIIRLIRMPLSDFTHSPFDYIPRLYATVRASVEMEGAMSSLATAHRLFGFSLITNSISIPSFTSSQVRYDLV